MGHADDDIYACATTSLGSDAPISEKSLTAARERRGPA
jgi:hypothetical protein